MCCCLQQTTHPPVTDKILACRTIRYILSQNSLNFTLLSNSCRSKEWSWTLLYTSEEPSTLSASWEYLMPKRKERAGRYIRESDERLIAGTTTMESQAKVVNEYCEREHYICE